MRYLLLHRYMCRLLSRAIAPLVSSYFIRLLRHLPYSLVVWGPSIRLSHEWLDASGNRPFIPLELITLFLALALSNCDVAYYKSISRVAVLCFTGLHT